MVGHHFGQRPSRLIGLLTEDAALSFDLAASEWLAERERKHEEMRRLWLAALLGAKVNEGEE